MDLNEIIVLIVNNYRLSLLNLEPKYVIADKLHLISLLLLFSLFSFNFSSIVSVSLLVGVSIHFISSSVVYPSLIFFIESINVGCIRYE